MAGFITETARRTKRAVTLTLADRRGRAVTAGTALLYLLGYLYAIGKLEPGNGQFSVTVAAAPLEQLFQQTFGTFTYEPVVLIRLGFLSYQFSLNTLIGLAIGLLVGINLGISYLAWRQPKACGIGSQSAGLFAGIPALLSGAACCAPVIVLLVGLQVTGALLVVFELLLPLSVLLLLGSLLVVSRQITPETAVESV